MWCCYPKKKERARARWNADNRKEKLNFEIFWNGGKKRKGAGSNQETETILKHCPESTLNQESFFFLAFHFSKRREKKPFT